MNISDLLDSTWSDDVANDPKHRPQSLDRPATTVRREWCRRPQEAHLAEGSRYRRLSVAEISIIQGFPPSWVDIPGIKETDRIAALGNAVPPPVSAVLAKAISKYHRFAATSFIEICAGIGGLSFGFDNLRPLALIEMWDVACTILRAAKSLDPARIIEGRVEKFDFAAHRGEVGLLCGGPPCQPWSLAGKRRGTDDPRDIMGMTPKFVSECEPEVFLFENVPGILAAKQNRAYFDELLGRLSAPKKGLSYGLGVCVLNSADFGLPQVRRRIFILGIREGSSKFAMRILTAAGESATHHDPTEAAIGRKPWVTLREALTGVPAEESWRRYNIKASDGKEFIVDDEVTPKSNPPASASRQVPTGTNEGAPKVDRITFSWPGHADRLAFRDGRWRFEPRPSMKSRRSLLLRKIVGKGKGPGGMAIIGDYVDGLEALAAYLKGSASMVYYDSHRRDVLEKVAEPGYVDSTWLSLVKGITEAAERCLRSDGVFVLHADETSAHYGRMVLDDLFGHEHHVSTFAWQKKYAPQNDFGKNTPTDAFDYLIVYSKCHRDLIQKIGLTVRPKDIKDEGDFRGCFTAGHKGARSGSEKTKFEVNAPPYHWEISESSLPAGNHWFDKHSGVLWYDTVQETGDFWLRARATDSKGKSAEGLISFSIHEKSRPGDRFDYPDRIWWLMVRDKGVKKGGPLRVQAEKGGAGMKGEPFSIVLKATGGEPFVGEHKAPRRGRYWEFSDQHLVRAIAEARVYFGTKGTALPSIKRFYDREDAKKKMAVTNWLPWYDYGKSEDATRHLHKLAAKGLINPDVSAIAKPEELLYHLVRLFAAEINDVVISMGDPNASMAAVALKAGCFSVHLTGPTPEELERWEDTASKRLAAVLAKEDEWGINEPGVIEDFVQAEPGPLGVYTISQASIEHDSTGTIISLNPPSGKEKISDFYAGLAGCSRQWAREPFYGSRDGTITYVLERGEVLDHILLSELAEKITAKRAYVIFELSDIGENYALPKHLQILHAPYDLIGRISV